MDNSFQRPGYNPDAQPPRGLFAASIQIFNKILDQLAGLVKLNEGEEWEAGIYLGEQPTHDYQYSQYLDLDN